MILVDLKRSKEECKSAPSFWGKVLPVSVRVSCGDSSGKREPEGPAVVPVNSTLGLDVWTFSFDFHPSRIVLSGHGQSGAPHTDSWKGCFGARMESQWMTRSLERDQSLGANKNRHNEQYCLNTFPV